MVDRIMVDPALQLITEADMQSPRLMPGGLCFICGTWIDHEREDAYRVRLERSDGERQEHLAHVGCLAEVAHPSSALKKDAARSAQPPIEPTETGAPETPARPGDVPADYLNPKPFTPDGR
jgi:hypothetical protein